MATLPSNVIVLIDGYEEQPDYNVLRSPMDNAIAKQRPRRTLPIVTRDVRLYVGTRAKKAEFEQWYKDDIYGGSGFFDYTDPIDNVTKQARFVDGAIRWSSPGNQWFINAQIETIG